MISFDRMAEAAKDLDETDPLARFRGRFLGSADVVSYLDGNSLGRPPRETDAVMSEFIRQSWGERLIRGWSDGWLDWPRTLGDRLGEIGLGAAAGQVVVADSTTVLLYKLARAALAARPDRREIVLDTDNFPTDRYVLEGIAAECGLALRWVRTDPAAGITVEQVAGAVGPDTALVVFSHAAYRSGYVADAEAITRLAHEAGALILWDLCHSVGVLPVQLDDWGVDLAVGCTYKYLNGGPGSPAFAYVNAHHHAALHQPIQGWLGRADPFGMGPGYVPADGIQRFISGTPPILGMVPLRGALDMLAEAGLPAVRAKSLQLTGFVLDFADAELSRYGVTVASPRDPARRGGHITLRRADFRDITDRLWERGVIPDFRAPDGIRVGLAPLSTSFTEVFAGLSVLRELVCATP
ncbi:kynureninase [Pseudonocardia asaccharolytica]|uniref:Kynureninase n=1 Tax=Pseudonocardia asaccharolytica DSM 44247 = NBRC 16224 TaxID=1123024 RepID=A0A511D1K6_9PSEU|nr:kynureninase [Pseudonocardia asaccharolytica]GEL18676.1 kynureninase [Pseudonocardia asaccharolytica DSM 44247 = NBRC 16224]